jgi:hypothetical protein
MNQSMAAESVRRLGAPSWQSASVIKQQCDLVGALLLLALLGVCLKFTNPQATS